MGTTTEELKKLYNKLGGKDSNIPKASTPGEVLNGINELDLGGGSNVIPNPEGEATATLNKIGINDTIYGFEKELPETTSADAGDVLTVNNNGEWAKAEPSGGNVVIYEADKTSTSSGFRLTLKNNKTIGDLLQDADNKKIIVIRTGSQVYYLATYINGTLDFSTVRYWILGRKIQISYVTSFGHAPTENEIAGATIELEPSSST